MTISWPETLPAIRWSGFEYQPNKQVQRFEVDDGGPAEQGRFSTAATVKCGFTLRCTQAQVAAVLDFFSGDAQCGAAWFTFTDPLTQQPVCARFLADSPPAVSGAARNRYTVQIQLEVKP